MIEKWKSIFDVIQFGSKNGFRREKIIKKKLPSKFGVFFDVEIDVVRSGR